MAEISGIFAVSHTPVMTNLPHAPAEEVARLVFDEFRRTGEEIARLNPDAIVLVSNDHLHNFFLGNMPAFCIGIADAYDGPIEGWLKVERTTIPGARSLSAYILQHCLDSGFDPAFSLELVLDHGIVTPLTLAGICGDFPVVPILVNCVQPPLPRMMRCIDLGRVMAEAIRSYDGAERVVVLATGGIAHDVGTPRMGYVNELFDRRFLELLGGTDVDALTSFSEAEVNSAGNGAEEIRNWLVAHGIAGCRNFELNHYEPVSQWYTGIALGRWRGE